MKRFEDYTEEELQELKFPETNLDEVVFPLKLNNCDKVGLCKPVNFFEQINQCYLCGRLA